MSVLEGRHPEHVRVRRETGAAVEQRRQALERELEASARRRRRAALVFAANGAALAVAAFVGWRLVGRRNAIRAAIDDAETPFLAAGFAEIASNQFSARTTLEADTPPTSCLVAVSTSGRVKAHGGANAVEADRSAAWCSCSADHVTIEAVSGGGGVALLRIDARALGGPLAKPWNAFRPGAWGEAGGECADAALDGWIEDHHAPRGTVDEHWLEAPAERASLKKAGFRPVAGVDADKPFGVVDGSGGECFLALGRDDEVLSLRAAGGIRRIAAAPGAIAWCNAAAETTTVWREGRSPVAVLAAPAGRVGGLIGARECAQAAGARVTAEGTWLREEDLAWDAMAVLRASALGTVAGGPLPAEPTGNATRLSAVAWAAGARIASTPENATVVCEPPLDAKDHERETVCASTTPVAWWRKNDTAAAAATAPLPFWLSSLEGRGEPDAVATIPQLLVIARRLVRDGFEPSTLEGVTELTDGVRVVGRGGEDAIVAIGLSPKPPWAFPYTDGVPWDLGDAPRVIELQPGAAVKLRSTPPSNAPLEKRRTVIFRHATHR
jgi:hypothetical protein